MIGALPELKAAPMVWSAVLLAMVVSQTALCSILAVSTIIDQSYQGPGTGSWIHLHWSCLSIQPDHHRSCDAMGL